MSAVGLLLLEDPKARARAEARIRAGKGNRRSFFGRSANAPPKGRKPSLPPTIPDVDDEENPVIVRPSTSLSIPVLGNGKKKSEGSERSNSRNSIFGRKNSVGESSIKSGTSGSSQFSGTISMSSYATYASDAPERQIKDHTPFSQSHMNPGASLGRSNLPLLATVEEGDRPVRASAQQGADRSRFLQPSSARRDEGPLDPESDAASSNSRATSPISLNPPSLPPAARISTFDDTIFNGVTQSPASRSDENSRPSPLQQTRSAFRSSNTLLPPKDEPLRNNAVVQVPGAFPSSESIAKEPALPTQSPVTGGVARAALPAPVANRSISPDLKRAELSAFPKEPLRQVEGQLPLESPSDPSLRSNSTGSSQSSANPEIRIDYTLHPHGAEYARSSISTGKSPAQSVTSGARESTVFSETTWEDDIDYIYEQGAEAACDFEWEFDTHGRIQSMASDGGVRLSGASSRFHAQAPSVASDVSRRDSRTLSGVVATIAERRHAQKVAESTRGFSVGHRGFAAARHSEDSNSKKSAPPTPAHLNLQHPIKENRTNYNLPNPDSGTPRSPFTPSMTQFPMPPASGRQSDNLSEPESWRNGPKHRKSSSYGSIESSARASAATHSTKETNRWSVASQSSVPSLVHSRPTRTSSVNKGMISAPLSVLPQHPENDRAFEVEECPDDSGIPSQPSPERDNFVLRRPQTSGERLLLQAAGRQRYRPATPNGGTIAPRVYQPTHPAGNRPQSSATTGSAWI